MFPLLLDTLEPVRVRSLLETFAFEEPEELVPLFVVTDDGRELSTLFLADAARELTFVSFDDEREVTPSRLDMEREFSLSLNEMLRRVSELPFRNEELLLSVEELRRVSELPPRREELLLSIEEFLP